MAEPEYARLGGKLYVLPPGWRAGALRGCDYPDCDQPAAFVHAIDRDRLLLALCPAHQSEIDRFQQHCRAAGDPEPVVRERLRAAFPFWRTEEEESDA